MNSYVKIILILFVIISATTGCEDMNEKHRHWLENGEIVYIGKVDSLKAFAGNERILFRYWISDPRAKTLQVTWSLGHDSLEIPVPAHLPVEPFDLYIGRNEKTIVEGNHTFNWITHDQNGNRSIVVESTANVYGQRYKSRLTNHPLLSAEASGTNVTLNWGSITSSEEVGLNVAYTNTSGVPVIKRYKSAEATTVVVPDVKLTAPVTYTTLYLPEKTAIDTFSTDPQRISIQTTVNVVLKKPVTDSGDANATTTAGDKAVDGDRTTATRWVTTDNNLEHWVEVDLQGTFTISGFQMWRDMSNATQQMPQFRLQAWIGGGWVNVVSEDDNRVAVYYKEFAGVTTNRVRLYFPAYLNNRIRLNEFEVYSIVRYE